MLKEAVCGQKSADIGEEEENADFFFLSLKTHPLRLSASLSSLITDRQ